MPDIHTHYKEDIDRLFRGANRDLAEDLIKIIFGLEEYWPMTLRQIYYRVVAALLVPNKQAQYRRIGKVMSTLRWEEIVPWSAIEDRTRTTTTKRGLPDVIEYIHNDLQNFLNPEWYGRCYIQEQENYVEVSIEKDALLPLVESATWMFCTRVNVTRGQPSATMMNDMAERFDRAIMNGKNPILLHFGDLDPTGVQIPISIKNGLYDHHGIDVDVRNVALTPQQCRKYNLPISFDAAKTGDPNHDRWIKRFGSQAPTELDALNPPDLKSLVKTTLEGVYDLSGIGEQQRQEALDREKLKTMRSMVMGYMRTAFPQEMRGI
ncbi:MAG: hypothetical protein HQL69_21900 [Magnetococcales bacterium]|nr:hypothetical protein [Magnetococcales bacterium]